MRPFRLAILGSHPIPYHAPLYRLLASHPDLEMLVLYGNDYGVRPRPSTWGIQDFVWKTNITEGYPHVFLRNWSPKPDPSSLTGKLNPHLIPTLYRFHPDVVLIMGYSNPFQIQGIIGALIRRIPIIYLSDTNILTKQPAGFRGLVKPQMLKSLYKCFAAFLIIGERNYQHYKSFGVPEHKMFHFPYAVDNEHFTREAKRLSTQRSMLRERWKISDDAICIVYSGRLSPEKNIVELLRGMAQVPNLHLLVAGSGPEQVALEALSKDLLPNRHTFVGFLNQDQLGEAYAASDVFALTSHYEAWGLTCNEAMNFGLPLVLSDRVGACADLIVEGETGWSYPLGNIESLAHALENAGRLVRFRKATAAEAVRRRITAFSFENQAEGVIKALNSIAGEERVVGKSVATLGSNYQIGA